MLFMCSADAKVTNIPCSCYLSMQVYKLQTWERERLAALTPRLQRMESRLVVLAARRFLWILQVRPETLAWYQPEILGCPTWSTGAGLLPWSGGIAVPGDGGWFRTPSCRNSRRRSAANPSSPFGQPRIPWLCMVRRSVEWWRLLRVICSQRRGRTEKCIGWICSWRRWSLGLNWMLNSDCGMNWSGPGHFMFYMPRTHRASSQTPSYSQRTCRLSIGQRQPSRFLSLFVSFLAAAIKDLFRSCLLDVFDMTDWLALSPCQYNKHMNPF